MVAIEIGGGLACPEGAINLDSTHGQGDWKRRIQDGIPAADRTVQAVRASHVLEHIPAGQERIGVFNEVWRVLVDGGTFEVIVPLLVGTWHAVADPTHVSFWVVESFHYFDGSKAPQATYGIRPWRTLELTVADGWEGHWVGTPHR
jgi:hypothetical protein